MKYKLIALATLMCVAVACGVHSTVSYYGHKTQIIKYEMDGSYVLRANGSGRNAAVAMSEAKKTAVYDIVFDGASSTVSTVSALKPLVVEVNAKDRHQDYFNAFFADGGPYTDYVSYKGKRPGSGNFSRNKSGVQCQINVTVDVSGLKQRLREDNIIK